MKLAERDKRLVLRSKVHNKRSRLAAHLLAAFALSLLLLIGGWSHAAPPPTINNSHTDEPAGNVQFAGDEVAKTGEQALEEVQKISNDIQKLKLRVIDLNKDLRVMEEKLLFPTSTKYSVFVSLTTGQFFQLEGIKFKLDGKFVASHVYSIKQRESLSRGGVHRLYVTNLSDGKHSATVFFTGIGSNGRPYKRAVSLDFNKGAGSEYLEIAVSDDGATQEPVFDLKQW
jgi:hypothetical protein